MPIIVEVREMNQLNFWLYFTVLILSVMTCSFVGGRHCEQEKENTWPGFVAALCILLLVVLIKWQ